MTIVPLSPDDVGEAKREAIPDDVFDVFNHLIARNYSRGHAAVKLKDAVALLVERGWNKAELFEKHYMDVEESYEDAGWIVVYDQPAYCESYDATYNFAKDKL